MAKKQKSFANLSTETKLDTVLDYANFYTKALKNKPKPDRPFRLNYIDVFSGSGEIPLDEGAPLLDDVLDSDALEGSAQRALSVEVPFDRYFFSDASTARSEELRQLVSTSFRHLANRVDIRSEDANDAILRVCQEIGRNDRALVFLDPFGNNVKFSTLKMLAATGKVDLWYLFPSWQGIVRQVRKDGTIIPTSRDSVERILGFLPEPELLAAKSAPRDQGDLFGEAVSAGTEKIITVDGATRIMREQMQKIFRGGVLPRWRPLGPKGRVYYSLMFACANPSHAANELAMRVANQIMTRE